MEFSFPFYHQQNKYLKKICMSFDLDNNNGQCFEICWAKLVKLAIFLVDKKNGYMRANIT